MSWQVCLIRTRRRLQTKASALIRCPAEGVVSCLRGGGSNAPLYVCAAAACVETASAGTTPPPATEDVGRTTVLKSNKAGVIRDRARTVRGGMSPEHVFRPLADGRASRASRVRPSMRSITTAVWRAPDSFRFVCGTMVDVDDGERLAVPTWATIPPRRYITSSDGGTAGDDSSRRRRRRKLLAPGECRRLYCRARNTGRQRRRTRGDCAFHRIRRRATPRWTDAADSGTRQWREGEHHSLFRRETNRRRPRRVRPVAADSAGSEYLLRSPRAVLVSVARPRVAVCTAV